jgi:PEP-CTERM motif.
MRLLALRACRCNLPLTFRNLPIASPRSLEQIGELLFFMRKGILFIAIAALSPVTGALAASFDIITPSMDRWVYPFNGSPGVRPAASAFGTVVNGVVDSQFDDRDGQMLVRFSTSHIATPGLGAANYAVTSLRLTLTTWEEASFLYDPTYDSYQTLLGGEDSDAGHPVEIFGVGYRNGFTASTFVENSPHGAAFGKGVRNAYAAGFNDAGQMIDVSNNVSQGFEVNPFAIGQVAGLVAGDTVGPDKQMTFDINVTSPEILAYLQASLNQGYIEFMVTSLYPSSQEAGSGYPVFYTKESPWHDPTSENAFDHVAAQLSGEITIVPEPSTMAFLGLAALTGLGMLACWKRNEQ